MEKKLRHPKKCLRGETACVQTMGVKIELNGEQEFHLVWDWMIQFFSLVDEIGFYCVFVTTVTIRIWFLEMMAELDAIAHRQLSHTSVWWTWYLQATHQQNHSRFWLTLQLLMDAIQQHRPSSAPPLSAKSDEIYRKARWQVVHLAFYAMQANITKVSRQWSISTEKETKKKSQEEKWRVHWRSTTLTLKAVNSLHFPSL